MRATAYATADGLAIASPSVFPYSKKLCLLAPVRVADNLMVLRPRRLSAPSIKTRNQSFWAFAFGLEAFVRNYGYLVICIALHQNEGIRRCRRTGWFRDSY
jgi:hypothetical protein